MAEHDAHKDDAKSGTAKVEPLKVDHGHKVDAVGTVVTEHDKELIDKQREILKAEAEGQEHTNGPADNLTGDASESPADHLNSPDPYKRAFPPGSDDPTKA